MNLTTPLWTSTEAEIATGGTSTRPWQARRVVIDSRQVEPGDLFVALVGERVDGHNFVREALNKGAACAMVQRTIAGVDQTMPVLQVRDTLIALQHMGAYSRKRTQATIIAVTGSVGKTGSKEALRVALSSLGETYATQGNLNNHIGAPLSLANLPKSVQFGVFELGMNHAGELKLLSQLVAPDVALITNVEPVHLEFFTSVEAIADAKAEIFDGMNTQGIVILNADNSHFMRLAAAARTRKISRIIAFGSKEEAPYQLTRYESHAEGAEVNASLTGTPIAYRLGALGKHWALLSVAVLAVVDALELDLPKAAAALAYFHEPAGRGKTKTVKWQGGELTLIDDSYNASPISMIAGFDKLTELKNLQKGSRTVAVLGDMLELGEKSKELHMGLLPSLLHNQIDLVFTAGNFMKHLFATLPESMQGVAEETASTLAPKVTKSLKPHDLVLIKGSHGSKMHEVVSAIEKESNL